MARPLRIEYAGACYHVINRGNFRRGLFEGEGAAEAFERTLGETAERFGWRVHAYVIMRNHFHLAVELGEPNLSVGMKWLQGTWVRRHNGFRKLVGRPFQGRYKALVVEPGHVLAQVCHYIHLNPCRAGLETPEKVGLYRWSSRTRWEQRERPEWLDPRTALSSAGDLPDTKAGWRKYRDYLEFLATDDAAQRELVAKKLSQGWCIGSAEFKQELRDDAKKRGLSLAEQRFGGLERDEYAAERELAWESLLKSLAHAAKVDLGSLAPAKSAPDKVLLAAAMKHGSSVSNAWLASRLQMGQPATVSQFVRRWMLDTEKARAAQRLLSRVKT